MHTSSYFSFLNLVFKAKGLIPRFSAFLLLFGAIFNSELSAQTPLKVYLDEETNLDAHFIRNELRMVDFVRQRNLSDVQVMRINEYGANRATRRKLLFIGYGKFEGQNDTIYVEINSSKSDNQFYIFEQTTEAIKQGLLPYLMQTEWSKHLIFSDSRKLLKELCIPFYSTLVNLLLLLKMREIKQSESLSFVKF